jgi:hypothetical protein
MITKHSHIAHVIGARVRHLFGLSEDVCSVTGPPPLSAIWPMIDPGPFPGAHRVPGRTRGSPPVC